MPSTTTLPVVLQTGLLADRPGADTVAVGALYCANDDGHIYQSDGSSWSTWASLGAGAGTVTEADLDLSDVTTDDVSTAKHGFVPKAPNDATKYLDGTGAYSVPAGGTSASPAVNAGALLYAAANFV